MESVELMVEVLREKGYVTVPEILNIGSIKWHTLRQPVNIALYSTNPRPKQSPQCAYIANIYIDGTRIWMVVDPPRDLSPLNVVFLTDVQAIDLCDPDSLDILFQFLDKVKEEAFKAERWIRYRKVEK